MRFVEPVQVSRLRAFPISIAWEPMSAGISMAGATGQMHPASVNQLIALAHQIPVAEPLKVSAGSANASLRAMRNRAVMIPMTDVAGFVLASARVTSLVVSRILTAVPAKCVEPLSTGQIQNVLPRPALCWTRLPHFAKMAWTPVADRVPVARNVSWRVDPTTPMRSTLP